ncbi:MAG TPA: two-component regulator propeller domain-containing protein [Bryobacteraceae bacterium]|nr:two-component regulator propeller domain-containing protein [Bryobacteraceae bacterium]
MAFPLFCFGVEPDSPLATRMRDVWGPENGFAPGPVYAISQAKDGYLWIGTEQGLLRFDGQGFRRVEDSDPIQAVRPVIGLTPDSNGDLWVRPRRPSLLRFRSGKFDNPLANLGRPGVTVAATSRTFDGSLLAWMLKGEPSAAVLRHDGFKTVSAPVGFSRSPVLALAQLKNGEIWVGTRDAGLFRLHGNHSIAVNDGLPDSKVNCLLPTPEGQIWVGTDNGLVRWDGHKLTTRNIPSELRAGRILALARDRHSNLWIGTNANGLVRLDPQGQASAEDIGQIREAVTALFEDREGSIWVGRANRLERIRNAPFVTLESTKRIAVGPVYADPGGGVWMAPIGGGLMYVKGSAVKRISIAGIDKDFVQSLAGANDEIWVGRQNGELTHLRFDGATINGAMTYNRSHGLPGNTVSAVHRETDGTVWAGTIGGGAVKLDRTGLVTHTTAHGLASNVITSIASTSDGWMWFGTPRGLSGFSRGAWRTFMSNLELPSPNVNCLFADSRGALWVGTVAGLAVGRRGRIQSLAKLLGDNILGIAEDGVGWLWITTSTRVLRIDRRRLSAGTVSAEDFREYGRFDGLVGTEAIRRQRALVADDSGRIWLGSRHGVSMFDPRHGGDASTPAVVDIHAVVADGEAMDMGQTVRVPPQHRRIIISYAGLSLSSPERVRFRYRMDGFDTKWSEPVAAREAVYTNLGPGGYRFRVIASNPDGEWNGEEAAIQLNVQPAIWQTFWFRTSVVLIVAAAMFLMYWLRFHQLKRQLSIRFEERLAERTRIARELHDTLLQGFLSASMQLHVAADRLGDHSEVKPQVNRVLDLMTQVIEEGRNAVRGLRSSKSESLDLEEALSTLQHEMGVQDVECSVISVGTRRPLHPIIRDEVYRIGREAMVNAFRHSGASRIEAIVEYNPRRLRHSGRDNGSGIDSEVLQTGRDGHWGLSGMRERAERIGARLQVWSRPANGTEVELNVPRDVAFSAREPARFPRWFSRIYLWKVFHHEGDT